MVALDDALFIAGIGNLLYLAARRAVGCALFLSATNAQRVNDPS